MDAGALSLLVRLSSEAKTATRAGGKREEADEPLLVTTGPNYLTALVARWCVAAPTARRLSCPAGPVAARETVARAPTATALATIAATAFAVTAIRTFAHLNLR